MESKTTLPIPVGRIVNEFVERIYAIDPDFFQGVYLTGSVTLNDFYTNKSDIDFVVLCNTLPDTKLAEELQQIHNIIEQSFPAPRLSGYYISNHIISEKEPDKTIVVTYDNGIVDNEIFKMGPAVLYELKTTALTITGSAASSLPVTINERDLVDFQYRNINSYWRNWIDQHTSIFRKRIILFCIPRLTEWSVLGVARQLYTLHTGKIVSKKAAGIYCLEHLPAKFRPIIEEAIKIRMDNRVYPFFRSHSIKPSFRRTRETIECVNYLIDVFNRIYQDKFQLPDTN